ncbi:unnamed protein product, partial [Rotaria sordida]
MMLINYIEKSVTGYINAGYDSYFDNSTILTQFELDNARIHTARSYSLLDFGKSIGTRCPTDTIEYVDQQGVTQVIDRYFKTGPNKGLSKGLIEISKELNIKLPPKLKLEQLRDVLSSHPTFNI